MVMLKARKFIMPSVLLCYHEMRFEMLTEHEVELFALHINFFNLNEFFPSICMQHTDKNVPRKWLLGTFFGTVYCRIAGASGCFVPWTPIRALPWTHWRAYSTPDNQLTSYSRQWNTVIAYRAFGRIPLSSMPSRQIWPTTINSFKKGLL